MEWNTKWDWENLDVFNPKGAATSKKLQSAYWGIGEGSEDIDGSFNLSGVVANDGGGGGSASDVGNNSSTKSSISASTGTKASNISFECFPDSYNKKDFDRGDRLNGTSPLEASVCSGEPFIGLKLGKRTYFENSYPKSNNKTSSVLGIPVSSVSMGKKVKSSCQTTPISHCQVEGCNLDLSSAKEYHRKHRVCETHSKCPKVIVAGVERRFCQQCSRFHSMSEFDGEKRSCRRRLSDHNARRRKPQHEPNQFNSRSPYSSFYGVPFSDALNRSMPSKGARSEIYDLGYKEAMSSNVDSIDLRRALSLLSNNNSNNSWVGSSDPNSIALDHHHRMQHSSSPSVPQHAVPSQDYWQADQQSMDHHVKTNNHFQEFQIFKSPYENSFLFHPNG